ncbi:MAG: transposase [Victivallales bacterium]
MKIFSFQSFYLDSPLMSSWEKQGNRTRVRIRSRIEHVFGAMKQRARYLILRTIGINRAEVKLGLCNIAYNMERFCFLMRQTA